MAAAAITAAKLAATGGIAAYGVKKLVAKARTSSTEPSPAARTASSPEPSPALAEPRATTLETHHE
jgi:hypothetical protein